MTTSKLYRRGFTLIELLVVVSIIGLLSSVVLASVVNARKSGQDSGRVQALVQVRNALELYYSNNGNQYPSDQNTIESLVNGSLQSYIKAVPSNLSSVANSQYVSNGKNYELFMKPETGGQFVKNNGCDSTDYSNYNSGKGYCIGNNPSSALISTAAPSVTCTATVSGTGPTNYTVQLIANPSGFTPINYRWIISGNGIHPTAVNPYSVSSLMLFGPTTISVMADDSSGSTFVGNCSATP